MVELHVFKALTCENAWHVVYAPSGSPGQLLSWFQYYKATKSTVLLLPLR